MAEDTIRCERDERRVVISHCGFVYEPKFALRTQHGRLFCVIVRHSIMQDEAQQ
jgi:hypothetical protein